MNDPLHSTSAAEHLLPTECSPRWIARESFPLSLSWVQRLAAIAGLLVLFSACGGEPSVSSGTRTGGSSGSGAQGDAATNDDDTPPIVDLNVDGEDAGAPLTAPVCGNGKLEPGELCDDGNTTAGDGCSRTCSSIGADYVCSTPGEACVRVVTCGNRIIEGSEACDDGNTTPADGCAADCSSVEPAFSCIKPGQPCVAVPICGNGLRERGEGCDDGPENPGSDDGCSATCELASGYFCVPGESCLEIACGDGVRTPGEACDDNNTNSGDGCSATCTEEAGYRCSSLGCRAICGDGQINGAEQCDDGNRTSGDGCSTVCLEEFLHSCQGEPSTCVSEVVCGDGAVDVGEVCDPASSEVGASACYASGPSACRGYDTGLVDPPVCNNGVVELGEACDGAVTGCTDCEVDEGYACLTANFCVRIPECGDGLVQPGEGCDVGATSSLSCVACEVQPGYYCSGSAPSVCVVSDCGDGTVAPDEQCDDGEEPPSADDGCSASCTVESGWVCPLGRACQPICGNGQLQGNEECEEDSVACTNCKLNPGYDCDNEGSNCFATTCGNGSSADPVSAAEAGEGCDDGNLIAGDGCGPTCQLEPVVTVGPSPSVEVTCGDGLVTGSEECDDGNTTNDDGCQDNCVVTTGWECNDLTDYPASIEFKVVHRDFKHRNEVGGHPHMKQGGVTPPNSGGLDLGIVGEVCTTGNGNDCGRLDDEGKPSYAGVNANDHPHIDPTGDGLTVAYHDAAFKLWYRDTNADGVVDPASEVGVLNDPIVVDPSPDPMPAAGVDTITLNRVGETSAYDFQYAANTFYPLGSAATPTVAVRGFGYTAGQAPQRNWHFTTELRYFFQYKPGQTLTFFGDDDVWVFVNGRLAVDIGGIHTTEWGRVVLGDDGDGDDVDSDCSVHGGAGNNVNDPPDDCDLEATEGADNTDSRFDLIEGEVYEIVLFQAERHPTGSNFRLSLDGFIAPRSSCHTECGDGVKAGTELCDSGEANTDNVYGECTTSCTFEYCGDNLVDGSEQCDNGSNLNLHVLGAPTPGECAPGCVLPSYCGDNVLQSAFEVCDDGVNNGGYNGCASDCLSLDAYCGDGIANGPEGAEACDNGENRDVYVQVLEEGDCAPGCKTPGYCGDNIRNGEEHCDGSENCADNCRFLPVCGDGLPDDLAGEACDYGTFNKPADEVEYGGCIAVSCALGPHCGDEALQSQFEECDEGLNNADDEYDGCTEACTFGPRCGDGTLQELFGEHCDNGFNDDVYSFADVSDPCAEDCQLPPRCGDGTVQAAFELCDEGAQNEDGVYDGCTESCEWGPYCGDGVQQSPQEKCDDPNGNVAYATNSKGCSFDCTPAPYCGDGVRNGPEQCDDGADDNDSDYGGCSADCTLAPYCGDGEVQSSKGEQCDDGVSGSLACSPTCKGRLVR